MKQSNAKCSEVVNSIRIMYSLWILPFKQNCIKNNCDSEKKSSGKHLKRLKP